MKNEKFGRHLIASSINNHKFSCFLVLVFSPHQFQRFSQCEFLEPVGIEEKNWTVCVEVNSLCTSLWNNRSDWLDTHNHFCSNEFCFQEKLSSDSSRCCHFLVGMSCIKWNCNGLQLIFNLWLTRPCFRKKYYRRLV